MSNNKNLVFAILIVIGFIFFWDIFVVSRYTPETPPPSEATMKEAQIKEESPSKKPLTKEALAPTKQQVVVLEAPDIKIELDSFRGAVKSWQVKEKDHWVELIRNVEGKTSHFPLQSMADLNFSVKQTAPDKATLVADHPAGYRVYKTLALNTDPPFHTLTLKFENLSNRTIEVNTGIGWGDGLDAKVIQQDPNAEAEENDQLVAEMRVVGLSENVKSWKPGIIFGRTVDKNVTGLYKWVGVDNNHFFAAFIPQSKDITTFHAEGNKNKEPSFTIPLKILVGVGDSESVSYSLFVGPKKYAELKTLGYDLVKSVDFGFFGIIAKFLFNSLRFFESLTGNYGWAIVILTVCIQILVFPLTRKSLAHSVKMKELQPQLKKIQADFKGDPKRLQIETLNLYRKNGMKFMGMEGCFPMFLQIPIFFAFYTTLRVAYELRGAPWILWIQDLSTYDPYFVLPVLMGGGMFLQQKLTAVATDPAQAKLMLLMPIMMTIFFVKLPAGLVLYWVINSVATVALQQILQWGKKQTPQKA